MEKNAFSGIEFLDALRRLLDPSDPVLTSLSNAGAFLWQALPRLNWAGFYLAKGDVLYLGPFQGKPACTRIPFGKGVCGCAAEQGRSLLVPDVHAFPGHIACDGASRSELVVPLRAGGRVVGVLDLDSPLPARFTGESQTLLEEAAQIIESVCWGEDPDRELL